MTYYTKISLEVEEAETSDFAPKQGLITNVLAHTVSAAAMQMQRFEVDDTTSQTFTPVSTFDSFLVIVDEDSDGAVKVTWKVTASGATSLVAVVNPGRVFFMTDVNLTSGPTLLASSDTAKGTLYTFST